MKQYLSRSALALIALIIFFRLIEVFIFPVTQDEAYYFYWSKYLDLGYLDHPPMVAILSTFSQLFPESPWSARMGGFLLTIIMLPIALSLAHIAGLRSQKALLIYLSLSFLSFAGLIMGFIQTPDLPLAVFWLLAIHEAAVALYSDPRRWITAGIMTGLGLMSKYTMVIIGFVFLYALLRKKRGLLSPWPFLGGLVCLITFSPHLAWNAQNDWVSFRFQYGRGCLYYSG